MRKIAILGSTGSIGSNAVDIIAHNKDKLQCICLCAKSDVQTLIKQARLLNPLLVILSDVKQQKTLKDALSNTNIKIATGPNAYLDMVDLEPHLVLSAIAGLDGLMPTWHALNKGIDVAIANKESLVAAGAMLQKLSMRTNAKIIPVDSEHSGLFQLLEHRNRQNISRLIITASGGPFRNTDFANMQDVTPEQALKHPIWSMGPKNTIDSATLINKGLEVIEASHLFGFEGKYIDVLIHPQSIIHAMIEQFDGVQFAQLHAPDMRIAIAYALGWPDTILQNNAPSLDLTTVARLDFEQPDHHRFPALKLAYQALEAGDHACCVLNSANEIGVAAFLQGKIKFTQICDGIHHMLDLFAGSEYAYDNDWEAVHVLNNNVCRQWHKYFKIA